MKKKISLFIVLLTLAGIAGDSAFAQRRARPGSMKHTEAEAVKATAETKATATYIRDNAYFKGPIYRVGDYGGIEIGTGALYFMHGKYLFTFDAAKFKFNKEISANNFYKDRFEYQKLAEDFDYSGNYAVVKKGKKLLLKLYEGETKNVFASIELESAQTKTIELEEDGFLVKLKYSK